MVEALLVFMEVEVVSVSSPISVDDGLLALGLPTATAAPVATAEVVKAIDDGTNSKRC